MLAITRFPFDKTISLQKIELHRNSLFTAFPLDLPYAGSAIRHGRRVGHKGGVIRDQDNRQALDFIGPTNPRDGLQFA
ncbi:MAG: hypothetical protein L0387_41740 [Acidobacteria bacterium]|nr:hypothetical protein [Acidobacteriota bacterium]MCI0723442.1 hypothetical protein [Acidobacteriota bacterium]